MRKTLNTARRTPKKGTKRTSTKHRDYKKGENRIVAERQSGVEQDQGK
jgi:hypothetical protein